MDQDSTFMFSHINYLFRKPDIKIICGTIQTSIVIGRTQNKIIIYNLDQTFNRSTSDEAKTFAFINSSV